jgi:hypothetical protein
MESESEAQKAQPTTTRKKNIIFSDDI